MYKIMTSALGGSQFGPKLSSSPLSARGITPNTEFACEHLGGWKGQGEGVKIQGSLANSPFIWLHVGVDFNISGIENALDCVLLKQSSSNIVLLRQSSHKYWKALNSESRQACSPRAEP